MINHIEKIINEAMRESIPCFFISPHLDDAVLSAGTLINRVAKKTQVTVVTLFTRPDGPDSLSAKMFLKQCGYGSAAALFADRRKEDKQVLKLLNVSSVHLNNTDALWRSNENIGKLREVIGRYIPEFIRLYPTYRFGVIKGHVHYQDVQLIERLTEQVAKVVGKENKVIIFGPLGLGGHVDHVITRKVCEALGKNTILWSDFPYNTNTDMITGEKHLVYQEDVTQEKDKLIQAYQTQFKAMFPDGIIPKVPEKYFAF